MIMHKAQQTKLKPNLKSNLNSVMAFVWHYRMGCLIIALLTVWLLDVVYAANDTQEQVPKISLSQRQQALNNLEPIQLPPVPQRSQHQMVDSSLKNAQSVNRIVPASKAKGEPKKLSLENEAPGTTAGNDNNKLEAKKDTKMTASAVNELADPEQQRTVMKQLSELESHNIQFLLPQGNTAKEAFLNHMYRCENMQFGVVTSHNKPYQAISHRAKPQQTVYKLMVLSSETVSNKKMGTSFQASELLRVAHDYLSSYERNLLTVYGQGSRAVRIFPVELDAKLSAQIAIHLGSTELRSFKAQYFLQGSKVGLKGINLNDKAIDDVWFISPDGCYI